MPSRDSRSRSPARPPPAHRTWTPLLPLLSEAGLHASPLLTRLLDLTLDRTVLFCELPNSALRDISRTEIQEPDIAWALLTRVQQAASRVTPLSEVSDPRRYLPEGAADDAHLLGDPFELRARRARPRGWTWLEFLAAGGLLTGSALGLCLEAVFREDHFLREANRGSRDPQRPLLSFSARCHASGCSWLMLSVQVDESLPSHRSAVWHGGPRQRLSHAATPSPTSTSSHGWRYPGHLLAERVIRTQLQSIAGSWMSTRSAWFAWCAYMRAHWPLLPHFPATTNVCQASPPSSPMETPSPSTSSTSAWLPGSTGSTTLYTPASERDLFAERASTELPISAPSCVNRRLSTSSVGQSTLGMFRSLASTPSLDTICCALALSSSLYRQMASYIRTPGAAPGTLGFAYVSTSSPSNCAAGRTRSSGTSSLAAVSADRLPRFSADPAL